MRTDRSRSARRLAALSALLATLLVPTLATDEATAAPAAVSLPPAHAGFDYQIGGAYPPPAGVFVVSRDHDDAPAAGLYNICYVNAFQVQPGAEGDWDSDLLLHDANGEVVYDQDWGEALLDTSTAAKRRRIADTVDGWIDELRRQGLSGDRARQLRQLQPLREAADIRRSRGVHHPAVRPRALRRPGHRPEEHLGTGRRRCQDRAGLRGRRGVRHVQRVRRLHRGVR